MAGSMRKMAVYLGLVEDDDRYDEYDEGDGYDEQPTSRSQDVDRRGRPAAVAHAGREEGRSSVSSMSDRRTAGATALAGVRPGPDPALDAGGLDRITTIHPRTYNEAKLIGESFRNGTPVIMNLTDMDDSDAKRLVDFAAGLVFGLRGTIERVTAKVFLLSPANVSVTAEDKARIAESGFFNQS